MIKAMTAAHPLPVVAAVKAVAVKVADHAIWTMKSRSEDTQAMVRVLTSQDADQALVLYNELTVGPPQVDPAAFDAVIAHSGTTVFGAFRADELTAMVTLHLLPNALWDARPYALIENVVTRRAHQKCGFGRCVMQGAIDAAWAANAHKIMLMTGTGRAAAGFYEALGFTSKDKTAMVMRRP
ncbi:GNAT family N-acetyltransferase [Sulfitobacter sp. SK012]|uniref:GNAT family N-acetyltransferase n=1 Tax=Sulfitobacter sp. SK012 TaxID=1389005 RepID=UPI000E0B3C94|nr:GNAT family N-acetyltransferase [Sulfitobacter sp. SK012]AXI46849.1 GNAT family N-acetyltransferase [Sulfitobacter sp. SK012]